VGAAQVDGYIPVKDHEPSNAATDGQRYDDHPDEECGEAVDEVDEHPAAASPTEKREAVLYPRRSARQGTTARASPLTPHRASRRLGKDPSLDGRQRQENISGGKTARSRI